MVIRQIGAEARRPAFVSAELSASETIALLRDAGYDRFQLVNQGHHPRTRPPRPAREGRFIDRTFEGTGSGLFGRELRPAFWSGYGTCVARFERWAELHGSKQSARRWLYERAGKLTGRLWLAHSGWMDVHATTAATLAEG